MHGEPDISELLLEPGPESHKYSRGVLGLRTGSTAYPGAAVLSAEAAWRAGVGLVRFAAQQGDESPALGLPTPAAAVLASRPETVFALPGGGSPRAQRVDAWVIGCGTDPMLRSYLEREALLALLAGRAPVVVDAGALGLLLEREPGAPAAPVIATPHAREFAELWHAAGLAGVPDLTSGADRSTAASALATRLGVAVLLKGSRTVVASPVGGAVTTAPATPWLATAGTGDVLAGALGALIATHAADRRIAGAPALDHGDLAGLGVAAAALHDRAARIAAGLAAGSGTGGAPITALDVARALPAAHRELRG